MLARLRRCLLLLPLSLRSGRRCPHWAVPGSAAAALPWGCPGGLSPRPGAAPRSRGVCRAPAPHIMPLLDFFWACFKRAKVRERCSAVSVADTLRFQEKPLEGALGTRPRRGSACSRCRHLLWGVSCPRPTCM